MYKKPLFAIITGLALTAGSLAEDSALVDILVRKGVLTPQEATDVRAELAKEQASKITASKTTVEHVEENRLKLSEAISELRLYGDTRLRYQYENAQDLAGNNDRNRFRYRLRLGAEITFTEWLRGGVRLETGEANDSTNRDFGGYFDKLGDEVYVGLAYLQYTNKLSWPDSVDIRFGKHQHPFVVQGAWWDTDINPDGISESFFWGDKKEGFGVGLNAGQYVISDTDNRGGDTVGNEDAFLFVGQTEFRYAWDKNTSVVFAPMFIHESNGDLFDEERADGAPPAGENPDLILGDLSVLMLPVEYRWNMLDLPWAVFGTYGYNFDTEDRAQVAFAAGDASALGNGDQSSLFNVGLQVGSTKKSGDWQLQAEYRYVEAFAYTGNLNDSDWAKGLLNQQGFVLSASYNFTDFLIGSVTWFHSNDIDSNINIRNSITTESDGHNIDVVQLDLSWKF